MRLVSAAVCVLGLSACQLVLGDFTVEFVSEERELGSACEPDEYRCNGAELEVCAADRQAFEPFRTCDGPNACNLTSSSCRACTPGELECHGSTLVQCAADLSWAPSAECTADTRCQIDANGIGACVPRACVEGALRCEGALLLQCNRRGEFEESQLCATSELCTASLAQTLSETAPRARCAAPVCEPGQHSCDGAVLRRCSFARDAWDTLETCSGAELCNPFAGDCSGCTPGEVGCAGADVIRCSEAGGVETIRTCTSASECSDRGESCEGPACDTPGVFRCASGNGLEVCSPGGGWELTEVCVTAGLCSASEGRCQEPACGTGELRCVGKEQQECSGDRSRFELKKRCQEGSTCDPLLGCVPSACSDGQARCNGIYLEHCVAGAFERTRRCATPELCDAAAQVCNAPGCTGQFHCNGPTVQRCSPGRVMWVDTDQVCIQGETCDAGYAELGPAHCDQCPPGAYRCDQNSLLRCAADGLSEPVVAVCDNGCDPAGCL